MTGWEIAGLGWLWLWGCSLQLSLMCEVYRKTAETPGPLDYFLAVIWPVSAPLASAVVVVMNASKGKKS